MVRIEDTNQKAKLFAMKASSLLASLWVMPHVLMLYVRTGRTYAL